MDAASAFRLALLNPWQRGFPLVREPFAPIAAELGTSEAQVLAGYEALRREGSLCRIGGIFGNGAGGAALLAAMAVPPVRLLEVACIVSSDPGVNHNYEREHAFNLWFVVTGRDAGEVELALQALERRTGIDALRLRMQRAYRIDLGFDLRRRSAGVAQAPALDAPPIEAAERPLAALVESGLPLVCRPFDAWAGTLGCTPENILAVLRRWLEQGTLRRFGTIVRHHELGFAANAMIVFDVPEALVDGCGEALARESGITLAYRRERAAGWPYNLYGMVHGRDRAAVHEVLDRAIPRGGLEHHPRAVLFSGRRFKQIGARRFREPPAAAFTQSRDAYA